MNPYFGRQKKFYTKNKKTVNPKINFINLLYMKLSEKSDHLIVILILFMTFKVLLP